MHGWKEHGNSCDALCLQGEGAQEEYEWDDDSEGEGGVRPSRLRVVKRHGDEFVVGLDEAWQHAATSDDEYAPMSGETKALACFSCHPVFLVAILYFQPLPLLTVVRFSSWLLVIPAAAADYEAHSGDSSFRRRRRGGGSSVATGSRHLPPAGSAWLPAGRSKLQQHQHAAQGLGTGVPQVVATGHAEGRNVLRIRINRPAPATAGTAVDAPAVPAANGRKGRASNGRISDEGCPLQLLAGLANDVVTPQAQQQQQQGPAAGSNGGGTAQGATPEPVALVAKRLLRVRSGGRRQTTADMTQLAVEHAAPFCRALHLHLPTLCPCRTRLEPCIVPC